MLIPAGHPTKSWNSSFPIFVSHFVFSETLLSSNFWTLVKLFLVWRSKSRTMNFLCRQMPDTLLLEIMHCARNLQITELAVGSKPMRRQLVTTMYNKICYATYSLVCSTPVTWFSKSKWKIEPNGIHFPSPYLLYPAGVGCVDRIISCSVR